MSQTDPWVALAQATGAAGLAGIVLLFVPIIAITTLGEPEFDATREEVAAFFRNTAESSWADVADTVVVFGSSRLLGHGRPLPAAPPGRGRSALAFHRSARVRGTVRGYLFTNASMQAAGNRGADIDPGLAHFAFDMGNIGLPTPGSAWVPSPRSAAGPFSRQGSSGRGWAG